MKVASAAADLEREATSSDWPRRSTKPDAEGRLAAVRANFGTQ